MIFTELEKKNLRFHGESQQDAKHMPSLCLGFLPIDRQLQKLRAPISLSGHVGHGPRLGVILHLKQKNGGHEDDLKKKNLFGIDQL